MLNLVSKLAASAGAALTRGAQVSAATLAVAIPATSLAAQAATAPIRGLPGTVQKLGASTVGTAGCLADLSQISLHGMVNTGLEASAKVGVVAADATGVKNKLMGGGGGGGLGHMAAAQGAQNSASMNAALQAQRTSAATAIQNN